MAKPRPVPLLIAIEEAHKLLNPHLSGQTAFGIIARELRKYFVTLLVVDQRPSGIDDEVMSQLGTRITGWLGDEDDIRAVLTGLAGRDQLRGMLARSAREGRGAPARLGREDAYPRTFSPLR